MSANLKKAPAKPSPCAGWRAPRAARDVRPRPPRRPRRRLRFSPSPPRNVRALAAVAVEGGATHYDLASVDIPNKSATMVMLLSRSVPGESSYLYAPEGGVPDSSAHPFRVARFTNDTSGLLEGAAPSPSSRTAPSSASGMVDPAPIGAKATVPFALERGLAVQTAHDANEEGARLALIEGGRMEIERDWVTHTKYTIKNGTDRPRQGPRQAPPGAWNTRLHDAPKDTALEDNTGTRHQPSSPSRSPATARRSSTSTNAACSAAPSTGSIPSPTRPSRPTSPTPAPTRPSSPSSAPPGRPKRQAPHHPRRAREAQRRAPGPRRSRSTRSTVASAPSRRTSSPDALRKDLTDRLAKATARIDDITKRTVVLDMTVSEQSIRFRDLVNVIKMVKPLPVP